MVFLAGALAFCQNNIPNERAPVHGSTTVRGYVLSDNARTVVDAGRNVLLRLPPSNRRAAPHLCGMLQQAAGFELFLCWHDPAIKPEGFEHHVEVLRGRQRGTAALIHDFKFFGAPEAAVKFFKPRANDSADVLVDIQGGATWGTTYFMARDRQSTTELFRSSDYVFADLDRNGTFELIAWQRRPFDIRCRFGIFAVRFYPEVFARTDDGYRKIWPPLGWLGYNETASAPSDLQVVGAFADLNRDGKSELVVLQDRSGAQAGQSLAVYRLAAGSFRLLARQALPKQRIAYLISPMHDRSGATRIRLRAATPERCEAGGDPEGAGTAVSDYSWSAGRLRRAR